MNEPTIQIAPAPYVTVKMAAATIGLSEKALRRKIEDGKFVEGREYRRSPDGGIFISLKGFAAWLETAAPSNTARKGKANGTQG
ncbi:excisionase [Trinickia violacea]|uniref:Excisionase n=1 Tax=Trinickia violacea TaxID=2571746 RepID=A0A4P8J2B9_9BURK|nr:excisionase [Trinickia violacea]QCP54545.1 excisionase [Trinickia violacea]